MTGPSWVRTLARGRFRELTQAERRAQERALEHDGAELGAQHAAHQRPLALEELPHLPTARAAHRERVPAIGGLPAAGLAALDRELRRAVEGSAADALQLRRAELPSHPHAEFAPERVNRALQMQRQLAVRGHELEAPIRTRHRTRSEERRVGKECLTQCRSRWS